MSSELVTCENHFAVDISRLHRVKIRPGYEGCPGYESTIARIYGAACSGFPEYESMHIRSMRMRGYEEGTRVYRYEGIRVLGYEGTRVCGYEGTRLRGYEGMTVGG